MMLGLLGKSTPQIVGAQAFGLSAAAIAHAPIIGQQAFAVDIDADSNTPSFEPGDLPGLIFLIDYSDPSCYTLDGGGTNITAAVNLATGGLLTTPATDVPFEPTGWNGTSPCAHPTGAATRLMGTEAAIVANGTTITADPAFTQYDVFELTGAAGRFFLFGFGNSAVSASETSGIGTDAVSTQHRAYYQEDGASAATGSVAISAARHRWCWVNPGSASPNAGNLTCYVDGGAANPNAVAKVTTRTITVNQYSLYSRPDSSPDSGWTHRHKFTARYNVAHDSTQRALMDAYLVSRFGPF